MIAVREDKSLLAFDAAFPRRDLVLHAEAMRGNFSEMLKTRVERCEIVRVKYRPQTSLRVLYRVETAAENSLFTARVFTGTHSAAEVYASGEAAFYSENLKTVFWKFPFDRKIKQLVKIAERSDGCELVAYAPEKCATFRYSNVVNEPFAYAKIFADAAEAERIFSVYKNLPKTEAELFPNAVCYSPKNQTLLVEAVKGARLADSDEKDLPDAFQIFGAAVARFHKLEPAENLTKFSRHQPKKISETLEIIKQILPAHFRQAENLARNLSAKLAFENEAKVTLHGDVHAKNAIMRGDGKLVLIDLDQTSVGSAASDIGSFLGGLFYKEITGEISADTRKILAENFLAGYEKIRELPSEKSLNRHTATAIFTERCGRAISRVRVEGLQNFAAILAAGEKILEGGTL